LNQDEVTNVTPDLLDAVLARDNLWRAWKWVKANRGAPGIDGVRLEDFPAYARNHWLDVREQIEQGRYAPQPVRRVAIPKPDGGERLLGIPTILDRVIQQAIAHVLTPIFEPTFSASSPRAVRFRHFWQTFCWTSSTRNSKGGAIALPAMRTIGSFWSKASGPGSA
jgi:RNA-directed DNA polymerase